MFPTYTPARTARTTTRLPAPAAGAVRFVSRHCISWLRVSLGLIIMGFGVLKFFPGASPAEALAVHTTSVLTFGLLTGHAAGIAVATVETLIGVSLIVGVGLRITLVAMIGWFAGILSPLVLFPAQLFPGGLPTLEAQYVLKDVILVAAATVVAVHTLGARLVPPAGSN